MAKVKAVEGMEAIANLTIHSSGARRVIDCQSCLIGKQPGVHFGDSAQHKATAVDDRVHVDICGLIFTPTSAGNKYTVLFKDEFSCFRHVYFVKGRSDTYDRLRLCVAAYRDELRASMKSLFSDHGSEFTSNRTQEFLKERPYTTCRHHLRHRKID